MSRPNTKTLDHIVHLTPPGTLQETTEQFQKLGFTVLQGGKHTGGFTENALVILSDTVYLELISFIHPPEYYPPDSPGRIERDSIPWAKKSPGWVDYAFLGNGQLDPGHRISEAINERAGHQLYDTPEFPGGRERPDGEVLKWVITTAPTDFGGTLPFFCGDVTPREWRAPLDPKNTDHPSRAQGITSIRILTPPQRFAEAKGHLTSVIGDQPTSQSTTDASWKLDVGYNATHNSFLILSIPCNPDEMAFLERNGTGIHEVVFRVGKFGKSGREMTPYGKIRWVTA